MDANGANQIDVTNSSATDQRPDWQPLAPGRRHAGQTVCAHSMSAPRQAARATSGSILVAAPLKIVGGSGSPARVLALVPGA